MLHSLTTEESLLRIYKAPSDNPDQNNDHQQGAHFGLLGPKFLKFGLLKIGLALQIFILPQTKYGSILASWTKFSKSLTK